MFAVDFAQVGDNVQKQMDMKGFTEQGLADELGISKQVLNKIIKGSKAINMRELVMIASVMGTTADTLLTIGGEQLSADSIHFMEDVTDERLLHKINLIRMAIDEIHMLEELLELRELKPDDQESEKNLEILFRLMKTGQHCLLSTLLSTGLSVDEKLGIIKSEYSIPVDDKLRKVILQGRLLIAI